MSSIVIGVLVLLAILAYVFFSIRAALRFMHKEDARGDEMNRRYFEAIAPVSPEDVEISATGEESDRQESDPV